MRRLATALPFGLVLAPCAVLALACRADAPPAPGAGAPPRPEAGDASTGQAAADEVFAFLAARYDTDGDGRITSAEYARPGADLARLDRTGDGVLTAADFVQRGRRLRALSPAAARRARAVLLVAWYLQDDDDPLAVTAEELAAAHAAYDADADGRVGRREFEHAAPRRALRGHRPGGRAAGLLEVETTDPWERLLEGVDGDDDGFLTRPELAAFHARQPGAWTLDPATAAPPARSLVGRPAPDFTLRPPDGGPPVTLSDHAGARPVALVFGSYT